MGINLNGPMKLPPFWLGLIYQKRNRRLIVLIIHIALSTYLYFTAESSRFLQPLLQSATLRAHNSPCALHGVYGDAKTNWAGLSLATSGITCAAALIHRNGGDKFTLHSHIFYSTSFGYVTMLMHWFDR